MRAGRWRRGRGPRSSGRFTRTGGPFRGRSGCGCSGRPSSEIAILAYSALFLAEDAGILRILADKGRAGVTVRIALGDPDGPNVAERGEEEGIGDAMAAKIRNALTLYRPLGVVENIEIRLHRTVLYNSIYRADDQLMVNQHTYGVPAAQAPVFCLREPPAARWLPSTSTASSACGLVLLRRDNADHARRWRSRRFYSPSLHTESNAADQHLRASRHDPGPLPSAMRPCAPGSGAAHPTDARAHSRGRDR